MCCSFSNEENLKKLGLNKRQIKVVFHVKKEGKITNKEYQEITGVSKPTATRELSELVNKRVLERVGTGKRDMHYRLASQKRAKNEPKLR